MFLSKKEPSIFIALNHTLKFKNNLGTTLAKTEKTAANPNVKKPQLAAEPL